MRAPKQRERECDSIFLLASLVPDRLERRRARGGEVDARVLLLVKLADERARFCVFQWEMGERARLSRAGPSRGAARRESGGGASNMATHRNNTHQQQHQKQQTHAHVVAAYEVEADGQRLDAGLAAVHALVAVGEH